MAKRVRIFRPSLKFLVLLMRTRLIYPYLGSINQYLVDFRIYVSHVLIRIPICILSKVQNLGFEGIKLNLMQLTRSEIIISVQKIRRSWFRIFQVSDTLIWFRITNIRILVSSNQNLDLRYVNLGFTRSPNIWILFKARQVFSNQSTLSYSIYFIFTLLYSVLFDRMRVTSQN